MSANLPFTITLLNTLSNSAVKPQSAPKKSAKTQVNICQVVLVDDQANTFVAQQDLRNQAENLSRVSHFNGKVAQTTVDHQNGLVLVGIGKPNELNGTTIQKIAKAIYQNLSGWCAIAALHLADSLDPTQFGQLVLAL